MMFFVSDMYTPVTKKPDIKGSGAGTLFAGRSGQ
jgi:hypothetical protein